MNTNMQNLNQTMNYSMPNNSNQQINYNLENPNPIENYGMQNMNQGTPTANPMSNSMD